MPRPIPPDLTAIANERRGGFERMLGLRFVRVTPDEVVAEVPVRPELCQPYGLVHGGVHASIVETLASVGAALVAMPRGQAVVGLENSTSFLRGVREGTLTAEAFPQSRGRRTQVWRVDIRDGDGQLVATGSVRALCLDAEARVGGSRLTGLHGT